MKTIEEMKSFPAARKNYRPEKVEKLSEEQMKWFRDAKFGMFIHWGVYSMLGKGEWVLMNEHLDVRKYETLKDDFLAENFDAEQWAKNAKAAGMKYMVLTTRHHDGFCLFDSKCSDFTAMKGAAHRDFVKEYVEACPERRNESWLLLFSSRLALSRIFHAGSLLGECRGTEKTVPMIS